MAIAELYRRHNISSAIARGLNESAGCSSLVFVMSMDYPDYEIIRTKSKRLAFVWMLGDRLYYIGLLGTLFIIIATLVSSLFTRLKGSQVGPNLLNYVVFYMFVVCIISFFVAPFIKRYARVKAGIKD